MYLISRITSTDLRKLADHQRYLFTNRNGQYMIRLGRKDTVDQRIEGHSLNFPLVVKLDKTSWRLLHQHETPKTKSNKQLRGGGDQVNPTIATRSPTTSIPSISSNQLQYVHQTTLFPPKLQQALIIIITVLKVAIGVGSIIVTFGAGGDTIVKAISATIDSGLFYQNLIQLTTVLAAQSIYLRSLLQIDFVEGPEKVKKDTLAVVQQIVSDGNESQIKPICQILGNMLNTVSRVVGDWISTFIPDDAGLVGITINMIINHASKHSFRILSTLFDKIPTIFQELLKHPDKLKDFLIGIVRDMEKGLRQKGPTTDEMTVTATVARLKKVGQYFIPGAELAEKYGIDDAMFDVLFKIIRDYFEPNIERAVYVVGQLMSLIFVILTFNEICENGLPESIIRPEEHPTIRSRSQQEPRSRFIPTPHPLQRSLPNQLYPTVRRSPPIGYLSPPPLYRPQVNNPSPLFYPPHPPLPPFPPSYPMYPPLIRSVTQNIPPPLRSPPSSSSPPPLPTMTKPRNRS